MRHRIRIFSLNAYRRAGPRCDTLAVFTAMSLNRWDEAEELFTRGEAMSPEDRETLLANVDAELAATVRSLWLNSEIAESFLDKPLLKLPPRPNSWSIGDCVGGRFKIL